MSVNPNELILEELGYLYVSLRKVEQDRAQWMQRAHDAEHLAEVQQQRILGLTREVLELTKKLEEKPQPTSFKDTELQQAVAAECERFVQRDTQPGGYIFNLVNGAMYDKR